MDDISKFQHSFKSSYQNTIIHGRTGHTNETAPDLTFETIHPDDPHKNFIYSFLGPEYQYSQTMTYEQAYEKVYNHSLHQHDFFEMVYVVRGTLYQRIEAERHLYTEGSLCLLNTNIRHQEEFSTDYRCVFLRLPISFVKTLLSDMNIFHFPEEQRLCHRINRHFFQRSVNQDYTLQKEYIDFIPTSNDSSVKAFMYNLFDSLTRQFLYPTIGSSYMIRYYIIQILMELSDRSHYDTIPLKIGVDAEAELFCDISSLLQQNHGRISRQELQTILSYNPDYMNRIVKKYSGLSLHKYGMTFCMREAERLLKNTDMTITDICLQLGFVNRTQFYKLFTQTYGITPKEYRNKNSN